MKHVKPAFVMRANSKEALNAKYEAMDEYRLTQDDLPDGAFFQLAEDMHGWTADDWLWFSKEVAERQPLPKERNE